MALQVQNLHPNLTIEVEHRNATKNHVDEFKHWRKILTNNTPNHASNIEDDYDVVIIRRRGKIIHIHYLIYGRQKITAVYSCFQLMPKESAYKKVTLSPVEFKPPQQDDVLNIVLNAVSRNEWQGKTEGKHGSAGITCKTL
ncbi:MAG: hypothetical protein VXY83_03475 [Pseudomonadota bacterium]|nr:hypothetical protein [Pseudomonadota bacterium]